MKTTITILLLIFYSNIIFSQTATASDSHGSDYWFETDSWVDGTPPNCEDYTNIEIPNGVTLILKNSITLDCSINITIKSGGVLKLKSIANTSTYLTLGTGSSIAIEEGGAIETDNQNSTNHAVNEIIIDNNSEWRGNEGTVNGYKRYPSSLPIELLSFSAKSKNGNVEINWSTSSEINNDFFTIERSINGIDFKEIGLVSGAGNSSEIKNYKLVDYKAIEGTSYYRLKQTDFDNKYEYFDLIGVTVIKKDNGDCIVTVNPNPCMGNCTISMTKCKNNLSGNPKIYIMDISGNMILTEMPSINFDGSFSQSINTTNNFAPGIYLIKAGTKDKLKTKKIIVK